MKNFEVQGQNTQHVLKVYDLKLPRRLKTMKSSRATSRIRELKLADVSETTSVPIIVGSDVTPSDM
jgi:hypothetical protein